jgi:hypothetical protein
MTRPAFVPLLFAPGEAFQFDWSCKYAFIAGQRTRLDVAHVKLACSRAFWLVAYPMQSHEMLFDAHTRAFTAFGGVPAELHVYEHGGHGFELAPKGTTSDHWFDEFLWWMQSTGLVSLGDAASK